MPPTSTGDQPAAEQLPLDITQQECNENLKETPHSWSQECGLDYAEDTNTSGRITLCDDGLQRDAYSASFGMVDLDVDKLEGVIDECHRRVKHDIVGYMLGYKARASAQHSAAVEHERLKASDAISAKQGEVELLKQELKDAARQAKSSSIISTRLAHALGDAKGGVRAMRHATQCWYLWRQWAKKQALLKRNMQRAVAWYFSEYMLRRGFAAWRKWSQAEHRHSVERRNQQSLEAMKAEVHTEYAASIDSLKWQLSQAHDALHREAEVRAQLEEDMKQAFMRGVCALNIEAMSVMKRGMPPAGSNPFFAQPPHSPGAATDDTASLPDANQDKGLPGPQDDPQRPQSHLNTSSLYGLPTQPPAHSSSPLQPDYSRHSELSSPASTARAATPAAGTRSSPAAVSSATAAASALPTHPRPAAGAVAHQKKVLVQRGPAAEGPRPRAMHPVIAARKSGQ